MLRFAMDDLLQWKEKKKRKPLIIMGARQVGKTWLMKEFGKNCYEKTIPDSCLYSCFIGNCFDGFSIF